jgi:hypothetical protein
LSNQPNPQRQTVGETRDKKNVMKGPWDKILLIVSAVLVLGLSGWFVTKALAFKDLFIMQSAVPNNMMPGTKIDQTEAASGFVMKATNWESPNKGTAQAPKILPLFVSIPIVEINGILIDMTDPAAQAIRPPVSNQWLMDNNLDFLNKSVLNQDSDRDGYSNLEEWTGQTNPQKAESHPPYAGKLVLKKRQSQIYRVTFAARPDNTKFQIKREPTQRWPKPENFYLAIGETSSDAQIRLDSFEEKTLKNALGITVDASILNVTFLPKSTKHILVRNVAEDIHTYFAELEFLLEPGKTFFVKEGDTFPLAVDPTTKYRLVKVEENVATITYEVSSGETKTLEVKGN